MVFRAVSDAYHSLGGSSSVSEGQRNKDANKVRLLRVAAIVALVFSIAITAVCLTASPLLALTLGAAGIFTSILLYDGIAILKNMEDALNGVTKEIGIRLLGKQASRAYFTRGTFLLGTIVKLTTPSER